MLKQFTLVFLGVLLRIIQANIQEDLQNLNMSGIDELQNNITSKIPSKEDIEKTFAEKCRKYGGEKAFEEAEAAKQRTVDCIKNLIDFDQLQQEMEREKTTGNLDSVFKKYCEKSPQFKSCIHNFTTSFQPCLDEKEKDSVATVLNITEKLPEFICHKDGNKIALFIAEGGPECLNASKDAIRTCVETIFKKNFPNPDNVGVSDLPILFFNAEHCEDFFKLQTCVVHELEKCRESTPANIVDSLFNFVKKATPCANDKFLKQSSEVGSHSNSVSNSNFITSVFVIFSNIALLRFLCGN